MTKMGRKVGIFTYLESASTIVHARVICFPISLARQAGASVRMMAIERCAYAWAASNFGTQTGISQLRPNR